MFQRETPAALGNVFQDVWDGITDIFGGSSGGGGSGVTVGPPPPPPGSTIPYPAGWYVMSPAAQQDWLATHTNVSYRQAYPMTYLTAENGDDLDTMRIWAQQVRAAGHVPTTVPTGYTFAGEPCERTTGPGTTDPNHGNPQIYVVAPQGIRDTYHRLRAAETDDQDGGVIGQVLRTLGLFPDAPGNPNNTSAPDWLAYIKWGVIGVGVLVLLPYVLPSRRR